MTELKAQRQSILQVEGIFIVIKVIDINKEKEDKKEVEVENDDDD